jgi:hypothetical protein
MNKAELFAAIKAAHPGEFRARDILKLPALTEYMGREPSAISAGIALKNLKDGTHGGLKLDGEYDKPIRTWRFRIVDVRERVAPMLPSPQAIAPYVKADKTRGQAGVRNSEVNLATDDFMKAQAAEKAARVHTMREQAERDRGGPELIPTRDMDQLTHVGDDWIYEPTGEVYHAVYEANLSGNGDFLKGFEKGHRRRVSEPSHPMDTRLNPYGAPPPGHWRTFDPKTNTALATPVWVAHSGLAAADLLCQQTAFHAGATSTAPGFIDLTPRKVSTEVWDRFRPGGWHPFKTDEDNGSF